MPTQDEGFEPLPALMEAPDAAQELRRQEALTAGPAIAVAAEPPAPIGRAPAYDFTAHRLVPAAAGGPLMTRGVETIATWVEKCLRTRRGENKAVDPDFGLDILAEDLLEEGEPFDDAAVAEYMAGIERALPRHPRITAVSELDVEYDPDDDGVFVTFRVSLDGDEHDLTFDRLAVGG